MRITIHRPAQIGGQITCISTARTSIIIDLGHNLPRCDEDRDPLDNDRTITEITQGCSAILYTHYHGDHVGLFHHVPKHIPQYIGKVAKKVICRKYQQLSHLSNETASLKYRHALEVASAMRIFHEKETLSFGDLSVTPYFVSHSAYDAYMFLIEAEGKRILHTGDFRGHGYLSKGLLPMIQKYIGQVDVLIVEGTMLGRKGETVLTESALCEKAVEWMKQHKYVFVLCSSTDMERLASFKNANSRMFPHRPLIADAYQKDVLDIFTSSAGKKTSCFNFGTVYVYSDWNQKLNGWMIRNGFTMFIRPNEKFHKLLDRILPILPAKEQPFFVYSMWEGYMSDPETLKKEYVALENRFDKHEYLHTSGHATMEILREVCRLTNPRSAIVPIHREGTSDFAASIGIAIRHQEKVVTENCSIDGIDLAFL